jgi:hypothetical protein
LIITLSQRCVKRIFEFDLQMGQKARREIALNVICSGKSKVPKNPNALNFLSMSNSLLNGKIFYHFYRLPSQASGYSFLCKQKFEWIIR